MNRDVGIDATTYGLGAGIFYLGYLLFEVPSNLGMQRFGVRKWLGRIMVSWGVVSTAFALTNGATLFLVLRFLLGVAEAGFFPGVILYLTYWYPAAYRAKTMGIFMVALPAAGLIGSPISAAILGMDGVHGLAGWRWIFILEGLPTVAMGVAAWFYLSDRPARATWLTAEQRDWLQAELDGERRRISRVPQMTLWQVLSNRYVLVMALVYAGAGGAATLLSIWMPLQVKSFHLGNFETGLVSAIPFGVGAVAMVVWGRSSDLTGERLWHNILPLVMMTAAIVGTFLTAGNLWLTIVLLTLVAVGSYSSKGPFWALSSEWLGPSVAAAGIAQINALGTASAFFFNFAIGWILTETGSFALAILPVALTAAAGVACLLTIGAGDRPIARPERPTR